MLKLHGAPLSNFYNITRQAILEKGLDCEFVFTPPSQDPAFLAKSAMGKVPMLETEQGYLTETDVILNYLEEACGGIALFPAEPFARARVRQVMKIQELYMEGALHPLIGLYFGREVPEAVKAASLPAAQRGLAALGRLLSFSPWACGETFSAADVYLLHTMNLARKLAREMHHWDPFDDLPGLAEWHERVSARAHSRTVYAENQAAFAAFVASQKTPA